MWAYNPPEASGGGGGLVDRGSHNSWDYTIGSPLVADGAFNVLDCSAIVPDGAKWIKFRMQTRGTTAGFGMQMGSDAYAASENVTIVDIRHDVTYQDDERTVPCSTDRKIKYYIHNSFSHANLLVQGWSI